MEDLTTVFVSLIPIGGVLVFLGLLAFWIWMIVDCASHETSEGNEKVMWILLLVFTSILGALIYYSLRRRKRLAGEIRQADEPPLPTNSLASTSLGLGIAGIPLLSLGIGFFSCIGAVICGHIALSQIKKDGSRGREMAIAALILGYFPIVLILLVFLIALIAIGVQYLLPKDPTRPVLTCSHTHQWASRWKNLCPSLITEKTGLNLPYKASSQPCPYHKTCALPSRL